MTIHVKRVNYTNLFAERGLVGAEQFTIWMCSSDSVEVKGLLSLQLASLSEEFVVVPANVV